MMFTFEIKLKFGENCDEKLFKTEKNTVKMF